MDEHQGARVACATYTHARRLPMVLGKIGDWTPPFQLTIAQVAVLLIVFLIEVRTWKWWGPKLDPVVGIVTFLAVPSGLAWLVRRARVEGRSLARAVVGWVGFLLRPRTGRVGGRANRPARPAALGGHRVYVADLQAIGVPSVPSAPPVARVGQGGQDGVGGLDGAGSPGRRGGGRSTR